MGKHSKISYCDSSWSPWIGCTPVSDACANCYAAAWAKRAGRDFATVVRASHASFYAPLTWKKPKRIFVCELSDFLHPDVPIGWLTNAVEVMRGADRHTYLILTKRPERWAWFAENWPDVAKKVWLGVTAENQEQTDKRIPTLLETPAAKRWVSLEPLLEPVKLSWATLTLLNFAVVGAESGPNRRECKVEWIEDMVDQCRAAGVPVYVKQGSHRFPGRQGDIPDHLWTIKEMPT